MTPLGYLRGTGVTVEAVGDKLRASPAERLTPELRQYLRDNRSGLLIELATAKSRLSSNSEAVGSSRYVSTAATASPEWRMSRDQFIDHLMSCRDCYAPRTRYCAAGYHLRRLYIETTQEPRV